MLICPSRLHPAILLVINSEMKSKPRLSFQSVSLKQVLIQCVFVCSDYIQTVRCLRSVLRRWEFTLGQKCDLCWCVWYVLLTPLISMEAGDDILVQTYKALRTWKQSDILLWFHFAHSTLNVLQVLLQVPFNLSETFIHSSHLNFDLG